MGKCLLFIYKDNVSPSHSIESVNTYNYEIRQLINSFISYQFEPHEEKRTKKYPESIFWVKDGEVIAEIEKSKYFWVSPQIWKNIMSMFSLEYTETQQVIKDWLEEHYGLGGLTPYVD
jgi:hypothetical protein